MVPGCLVVLVIILLLLTLIELNSIGFIITCEEKSKLKSMHKKKEATVFNPPTTLKSQELDLPLQLVFLWGQLWT